MKNDAYWVNRMKVLEKALLDTGYEYVQNLEHQYDKAIKSIESELAAWYQRFAGINGITLAEARRLLTTQELKEFQWSVEEYIQYGREHAISGQWARELENSSARVHVSRLDSIKLQLQQQAELLHGAQTEALTESLGEIYKRGYYHTGFEIQKGLGVGWTLHSIDERQIKKVLAKPWTEDGQTFSDRIWKNKQTLVNTVNTQLTQMIMRGDAPDKAIKEISDRFKVSKLQAGRLVMTESAAFANEARKDCFQELGVEQFIIVETLDKGTCELCGTLDGKVYPMSEYAVGMTAPPFHPWCRGTTAPYFKDMEGVGNRFARTAEGSVYEVSADMTYAEWAQRYISDATSDADKAMFERYKRVLGDLAPERLEDFVTIMNNKDKWAQLKYQYRTLNRYEIDGNIPAAQIIELDNAAFYTKKTGFNYSSLSGKIREKMKKDLPKGGNAAAMEFGGKIYFSHSKFGEAGSFEHRLYQGKYPAVTLTKNRIFTVKDLGDGIQREYDTEAKFLEFVAAQKQESDKFTITILSEKHICESCQGVVAQFKEKFPNATVNIISGKRGYNGDLRGSRTWKHRKKVKANGQK